MVTTSVAVVNIGPLVPLTSVPNTVKDKHSLYVPTDCGDCPGHLNGTTVPVTGVTATTPTPYGKINTSTFPHVAGAPALPMSL